MMDKNVKSFQAELRASDSYCIEGAKISAGAALYEIFERSKLTRAEFAEKIGKSKAYVSKLFKYDVNFTVGTLALLGKALGHDLKIEFVRNSVTTNDDAFVNSPHQFWHYFGTALSTPIELTDDVGAIKKNAAGQFLITSLGRSLGRPEDQAAGTLSRRQVMTQAQNCAEGLIQAGA